jgi:tRNA(Arg) A34 adenosine deaminase TadA
VQTSAAEAWAALDEPWRLALEQAWASVCAGSLGIGAVITDADGAVVASGRNRLMERDAGEDHLAGSSLAHAERNALAKVPWLGHAGDHLTLWTTLEPCLMCAGAIRLSRIDEVRYLVADPIFEGTQRARELNEFIASGWPDVVGPRADPLAVIGILFPAHLSAFWGAPTVRGSGRAGSEQAWVRSFPSICALAGELASSRELIEAIDGGRTIEEFIEQTWDRLVAASADLRTQD